MDTQAPGDDGVVGVYNYDDDVYNGDNAAAVYDDDEGYEYYDITTIDPGPSLLVATLLFCLSMYAMLPCMLTQCNRRRYREEGGDRDKKKSKKERRRKKKTRKRRQPRKEDEDPAAVAPPERKQDPDGVYYCNEPKKEEDDAEKNQDDNDEEDDDDDDEQRHPIHAAVTRFGAGTFQSEPSPPSSPKKDRADEDGDDEDDGDDASKRDSPSVASSSPSVASRIGTAVLDAVGPLLTDVNAATGKDASPSKKGRFGRRARAVMERRDAELDRADRQEKGGRELASPDGIVLAARSTSSSKSLEEADSNNFDMHDEVSFHDAVDAQLIPEPPIEEIHTGGGLNKDDDDDGTVCCGLGAIWKPKVLGRCFGRLLSIAEWDYETRRIYKLGFPFFLQALLEGAAEFGRVAIIGRLLGTKELAAYVIVDLLISFTSEVLGGIHESLVSLLSHSIGSGNRTLTGQYVQLSIELYVLFFIPFLFLWYFFIEDTLMLLGFDAEVAAIGKAFAVPYLFAALLNGVLECIHGL